MPAGHGNDAGESRRYPRVAAGSSDGANPTRSITPPAGGSQSASDTALEAALYGIRATMVGPTVQW
jgi:hypothetical protein